MHKHMQYHNKRSLKSVDLCRNHYHIGLPLVSIPHFDSLLQTKTHRNKGDDFHFLQQLRSRMMRNLFYEIVFHHLQLWLRHYFHLAQSDFVVRLKDEKQKVTRLINKDLIFSYVIALDIISNKKQVVCCENTTLS